MNSFVRNALLAIACGLAAALAPGVQAAAPANADPLPATRVYDHCSWNHPGVNPFMGDVVGAVDRYRDIPPEVRAKLKARMEKRDYDDLVGIRRDSIEGRGGYDYGDSITDMHFGTNQLCHTVTRSSWTREMLERGLVYCESGYCILVPTVCRNVSRISRTGVGPEAAAAPPLLAAAPAVDGFPPVDYFGPSMAGLPADDMVGEAPWGGLPADGAPDGGGPGSPVGAPAPVLGGFAGGAGGGGPAYGGLLPVGAGLGGAGLAGPGLAGPGLGGPGLGGAGLVAGGAASPAPLPATLAGPTLPAPDAGPTPPVPEPAAAALLLLGLAGVAVVGRGRRPQAG